MGQKERATMQWQNNIFRGSQGPAKRKELSPGQQEEAPCVVPLQIKELINLPKCKDSRKCQLNRDLFGFSFSKCILNWHRAITFYDSG